MYTRYGGVYVDVDFANVLLTCFYYGGVYVDVDFASQRLRTPHVDWQSCGPCPLALAAPALAPAAPAYWRGLFVSLFDYFHPLFSHTHTHTHTYDVALFVSLLHRTSPHVNVGLYHT